MPIRLRSRSVAAAFTCALALAGLAPAAHVSAGTDDGSGASGTVTADATATPTTIANDFIPEDRELSECISALPKPDCGSQQQGGWRQYTVFAVMMAGMAVIGARIAIGIRRRDRATRPEGLGARGR